MLRKFMARPGGIAFGLFTVLYAVLLGFVFGGTWALDVTFVQPDAPTTFPVDQWARNVRSIFTGEGMFTPLDATGLLGSPYFWQELKYALAAYLSALGVVYYLRGAGLSRLAAYFGGAAYGLMGYSFTLFSAGHQGWFWWLMYGPFAFGLVDRLVRFGCWRHGVLLGGVLAWGAARQPDMWMLFTAWTFAYGLFKVVWEGRRVPHASRAAWLWKTARGVALTGLVAALIGTPAFYGALTTTLADRDRQIVESVAARSADADRGAKDDPVAKKAAEEKAAAERWRFCTSWSLPPEDAVEFFWPRIHGDTSDVNIIALRQRTGARPATRYTGRLGMPIDAPHGRDVARRWMPYRQHALYMGFITVLLALVGAARVFFGKSSRGEIAFWTVSAGVFVLVAMGCFTPFYNLVYALPFGNYLRAPVKFVHLVEFAVAVLAGFGMEALLRRVPSVRVACGVGLALTVANAIDLARIDALYVGSWDVSFVRAENHAADDVVKAGGGKVAILVAPEQGEQLIGESFSRHLAETADLKSAQGDYRKSRARFLFMPAAALGQHPELTGQIQSGAVRVAGTYQAGAKRGILRTGRTQAQMVLLEVPGAPKGETPGQTVPFPTRAANYISLVTTLVLLAVLGHACVTRKM